MGDIPRFFGHLADISPLEFGFSGSHPLRIWALARPLRRCISALDAAARISRYIAPGGQNGLSTNFEAASGPLNV